ncbi:ubiquitin-protein ligase E3 RBBP6 family protein [Schizosaccharomyces japonicus yFS275]|uniref:Ubiquitin-protein ligase E3 RBBP6 family protein n=1 Tax=Schizosaccharomyces japonicus (strain yFS275 / FY16936) TaxID=402676 RepID=B6K0V3_SCHJY|nr:ubiquitin-protein ligase E3 RBBP6 family protein [Schizosaccharomyces japonicus yFS275]EEB07574.1 ubiquitin-protein ligase E3 RBBP6 family protein [Schizosaccharomyces japonicus yFS275]
MSSVIYYKFKSQKDPSKVTFDGTTGMSVFDVKREIIQQKKLGNGLDFDLLLYNANTNEEYDDDTYIIPRSSSVIVRRLPAQKPGRGTAARYVAANAAPNVGRNEFGKKNVPVVQKLKPTDNPVSRRPATAEDAAIQQMLQTSSDQWRETQDKMATATPIYKSNQRRAAPAFVPEHPPPNGYICFRCGQKGHWIQACPTNSDPTYDGKPRVKRTTGIPRSFLKTVEQPTDGDAANVMINAEGEYVVAQPDVASWESYQSKKKALSASDVYKMEPKDANMACGLCKHFARQASVTPCCKKLFCEECIQNALLESDFVCPKCKQKDVLLDSVKPDFRAREKIDAAVKSILGEQHNDKKANDAASSVNDRGEKRKHTEDDDSSAPAPKQVSRSVPAHVVPAKPVYGATANPKFHQGNGPLPAFPPFPPFMIPGLPIPPMMPGFAGVSPFPPNTAAPYAKNVRQGVASSQRSESGSPAQQSNNARQPSPSRSQ